MSDILDRTLGGPQQGEQAITSLGGQLEPGELPEIQPLPPDNPGSAMGGEGFLGSAYGSVPQPLAEIAPEEAVPHKDGPAKIALKQIVLDPGPWFWHLLSMWADAHAKDLNDAGVRSAQDVANAYLREVLIGHARIFQQAQADGKIRREDWQYDFQTGLMDAIDEMMRVAAVSHRKQFINQGVRQTLQRLSGVFPDGKVPPEIEELAWLGEEH